MEEQRLYGLKNEKIIIEYLHGKMVKELNLKWKEHIMKIFPHAKEDSVIYAKHYPDMSAKPDMMLIVDGEDKYVSIKTGSCPSVHHEPYCSFKRFLMKMGISKRTIEIIRFYHYGDSKKLKTCGTPIGVDEMKEKYLKYFNEASKELNNEQVIKAVVSRSIIRGTGTGKTPIDFLYYGDLEHGKVISKDEIYEIILANRDGTSPIHISSLNYYPNTRKLNSKERNSIRIKWPMLSFLYYCDDEDIEKMKVGLLTSRHSL